MDEQVEGFGMYADTQLDAYEVGNKSLGRSIGQMKALGKLELVAGEAVATSKAIVDEGLGRATAINKGGTLYFTRARDEVGGKKDGIMGAIYRISKIDGFQIN